MRKIREVIYAANLENKKECFRGQEKTFFPIILTLK